MRSPLFVAIDLLVDGRLNELLDLWTRANVPNPVAARLLFEESGVMVSRETIRQWKLDLSEAA